MWEKEQKCGILVWKIGRVIPIISIQNALSWRQVEASNGSGEISDQA